MVSNKVYNRVVGFSIDFFYMDINKVYNRGGSKLQQIDIYFVILLTVGYKN